jgi:ATP-dependent Clp protease ATP-binding subunit ClpX
MAEKTSGDKLLYCSFCGKSQHEVRKLIAGPSVFICDECIELCNDIIRGEALRRRHPGRQEQAADPHEIADPRQYDRAGAGEEICQLQSNHYKRLKPASKTMTSSCPKSNILLIGPTGRETLGANAGPTARQPL